MKNVIVYLINILIQINLSTCQFLFTKQAKPIAQLHKIKNDPDHVITLFLQNKSFNLITGLLVSK